MFYNDNNIFNNRVISSGYLSDGSFIPVFFANGLNNYNNYQQASTTFFNNLVSNNYVGLIATSEQTPKVPRRSDYYLPGQTASGNNVSLTPNDSFHPTLINEASELTLWQSKLGLNHIKLGV